MSAKTQSMMQGDMQQRNRLIISVIIVVAMVAVLAIILLSNGSGSTNDYSGLNQTRLADGGFVIGNPDAKVTLVEFADYDCPVCLSYLSVMDQFFNDYVKTGKAKFEYRIFPTHGAETTHFIGELVECFEEQKPGSFWVAKDLLFQSAGRGSYDETTGRTVANQLGVDYTKALTCSSSAKQVDMDVALGERLGVNGTPAVMVRYGDAAPQFISFAGQTYNQGGPPLAVLAAAVAAGNAG
ncbi:MAG: thioredoxin domain-containing protein [Chloroflexota bacterium]